jgi:hypothetical protein
LFNEKLKCGLCSKIQEEGTVLERNGNKMRKMVRPANINIHLLAELKALNGGSKIANLN